MIGETSIPVKLTIAFAAFDTGLILVAPWCRKAFRACFFAYVASDLGVSFIAINTKKTWVGYARQVCDKIETPSPWNQGESPSLKVSESKITIAISFVQK